MGNSHALFVGAYRHSEKDPEVALQWEKNKNKVTLRLTCRVKVA